MFRSRRVIFAAGFVLSALLVMWLLGTRSQSRRALSNYKAALLAKGELLTFDQLTRGRPTNQVDSQAAITNAVLGFRSQRFMPASLVLRKYVAPGRALAAWQQAAPPWNSVSASGAPVTWEDFESQWPAADAPLATIREAMHDPDPDAGPHNDMFARRVNFIALRQAAQWLMGATIRELRRNDREAALENLEALAAMVRMERDEYSLVAQMIRIAICGLGTTATWEMLQAQDWNDEQLARMQKAWDQIDLLDAVHKGFLAERAAGQEIWRMTKDRKGAARFLGLVNTRSGAPDLKTFFSQNVLFPAYRMSFMHEDELFHLQVLQEDLEAVRALRQHHPWPEITGQLNSTFSRVTKASQPPVSFRHWISASAIPNINRAAETATRNETERELTVAAIALRRYQLGHGKPPASLAELVPEFLSAVPVDPMSGQPLRYRRESDSQFLLYSVGLDGKDDGGDGRPATAASLGLWEGRDAVWPSSVTSSNWTNRN